MKMFTPNVIFILSALLYTAGMFFIHKPNIEHLKQRGIANQEQLLNYDANGDEYESESLIEVRGIGRVLTYSDIYLATIPFLIISLVLAKIIFNVNNVIDEGKFVIFTNCIFGLLLLWLTTKLNVISTILYWSGIIAASFIPKANE